MRRFMQSVWLMIVLAGVMLPSSAVSALCRAADFILSQQYQLKGAVS